MKKYLNSYLIAGGCCIVAFLLLIILLMTVNKEVVCGHEIGLYGFNKIFLVGKYNDLWDVISDVIFYISIGFCFGLAIYGFYQLTQRRNILKVDKDILFTGIGILLLLILWIVFDRWLIVNCRPILIAEEAEASFPSTHVMFSTFILFTSCKIIIRRNPTKKVNRILGICGMSVLVLLCILGRLLSSMHWMTDVLGGFLIGFGMFGLVFGIDKMLASKEKKEIHDQNDGNKNC